MFRESVERGVAGCSESTSVYVLSVCCGLARERADRKAAEAEVGYWLLPREKPKRGRVRWMFGSHGRATCRMVYETGPPDRTNEREIWGGYGGKCDSSVRALSLVDQAGLGLICFASSHFANCRRSVDEVMERGLRFNWRSRNRRVDLG